MIIGISGVARSGKDTLANNFVNIFKSLGIKAKRYALADELKKEIRPFLKKHTGLDSFTQNDEEKKMIRPFLVAYGTNIRRAMNKNCWIETLTKKLKNDEITIVSDVRYENEADWIQENGFLIHIARLDKELNLIKPANVEETENDPILQSKANLSYVWQTVEGDSDKNNPFSLSEYSWAIFEQCFDSEEITKWQTTYPLLNRLNKTIAKTV
jgi:hypothetical protein